MNEITDTSYFNKGKQPKTDIWEEAITWESYLNITWAGYTLNAHINFFKMPFNQVFDAKLNSVLAAFLLNIV